MINDNLYYTIIFIAGMILLACLFTNYSRYYQATNKLKIECIMNAPNEIQATLCANLKL